MFLAAFLRISFFAMVILSFILCMIFLHFCNGLLFYFTSPFLFKISMQWAEYLSSSLVLLMSHLYYPNTVLKVSFSDRRSEHKFHEYQSNRAKGETTSDIVICNHQLYTDWVYIWALLTHMGKGGNVKITLKRSLQWIPIVGWGMKIVGFIFLSRKWTLDRTKFLRRISRLAFFKPFSFLIFPEGTTLCENALKKSDEFTEKEGIPATKHVLIPRSLGMFISLLAVQDEIEGVWDFTACYSDIPSYIDTGKYPEDLFGLTGLFGERKAPSSVHFVLRFIPIHEITPLLDDDAKFAKWLQGLYLEKDALLIKAYTTFEYPEASLTLPMLHTRDVRNVLVAFFTIMLLIKLI